MDVDLERAYKHLQCSPMSMRLPSNVRRDGLIRMIHAKRTCDAEEVNAIVEEVKSERKTISECNTIIKKRIRHDPTEPQYTDNGTDSMNLQEVINYKINHEMHRDVTPNKTLLFDLLVADTSPKNNFPTESKCADTGMNLQEVINYKINQQMRGDTSPNQSVLFNLLVADTCPKDLMNPSKVGPSTNSFEKDVASSAGSADNSVYENYHNEARYDQAMPHAVKARAACPVCAKCQFCTNYNMPHINARICGAIETSGDTSLITDLETTSTIDGVMTKRDMTGTNEQCLGDVILDNELPRTSDEAVSQMIDDAIEVITEDGNYMERIKTDDMVQSLLCVDWI